MLLTLRKPPPLDRRGYYRSPVTIPGYRKGKPAPNKGRRFPPQPLSPREALALLEACGRGPCGKRNRAMIVAMWRAGLRCGEMLALEPRDVDLEHGYVHVRHGKGDRARTVGLDPMACAVVADWAEARSELGIGWRAPLFCVVKRPSRGEPIHSVYVRNLLKQLAAKAGIQARVHPHGLRHTHAFELAGERKDLRVIRSQLGHSNLAITARYVEHLNPADVIDEIRARPWPHGEAESPSAA